MCVHHHIGQHTHKTISLYEARSHTHWTEMAWLTNRTTRIHFIYLPIKLLLRQKNERVTTPHNDYVLSLFQHLFSSLHRYNGNKLSHYKKKLSFQFSVCSYKFNCVTTYVYLHMAEIRMKIEYLNWRLKLKGMPSGAPFNLSNVRLFGKMMRWQFNSFLFFCRYFHC